MSYDSLGLLIQLITVSVFVGGIFLVGLNAGSKGQEKSFAIISELNKDLRARISRLEEATNDLKQENVNLRADRDRFEVMNLRMETELKKALDYIIQLEHTIDDLKTRMDGEANEKANPKSS